MNTSQLLLSAAIVIVAVNVIFNILFLIDPLGSPAGSQVGIARVTVLPTVCLTLPSNEVDFGNMAPLDEDNTTDSSPSPFDIEHCGNVLQNVTIQVADPDGPGGDPPNSLWDPPNDVTSRFFQFSSEENEAGSIDTGGGGFLVTSFTNIPVEPDSAVDFATMMNYQAANDQIFGHINISVPDEESPTANNSSITFTATQS